MKAALLLVFVVGCSSEGAPLTRPTVGAASGASSGPRRTPSAQPTSASVEMTTGSSASSSPSARAPIASSSVGATASPSTAPIATTCPELREAIARAEASHAGENACVKDDDCACYGGPICPNALVRTCPYPVSASAADALAPLAEAWSKAGCGGYIWSPYKCDPKCVAGRCASP